MMVGREKEVMVRGGGRAREGRSIKGVRSEGRKVKTVRN